MDTKDVIVKKLKVVTDSDGVVLSDPLRPGMSHLIEIYASVSGLSVSEIESQYAGKGYGAFKSDLADVVVNYVSQ